MASTIAQSVIRRPALPAQGRRAFVTLALTGLLMSLPQGASPQVLYGTLTGNVTDTSGGVAPGVTVEAERVGTTATKGATTDERGDLFSDLIPGLYNVTFTIQGFKAQVHAGVRVDSNAVRRVDARLEVSGVSETVEVTAPIAPLQTDRADVHVTQTARQVNELPLTRTDRIGCRAASRASRSPTGATSATTAPATPSSSTTISIRRR